MKFLRTFLAGIALLFTAQTSIAASTAPVDGPAAVPEEFEHGAIRLVPVSKALEGIVQGIYRDTTHGGIPTKPTKEEFSKKDDDLKNLMPVFNRQLKRLAGDTTEGRAPNLYAWQVAFKDETPVGVLQIGVHPTYWKGIENNENLGEFRALVTKLCGIKFKTNAEEAVLGDNGLATMMPMIPEGTPTNIAIQICKAGVKLIEHLADAGHKLPGGGKTPTGILTVVDPLDRHMPIPGILGEAGFTVGATTAIGNGLYPAEETRWHAWIMLNSGNKTGAGEAAGSTSDKK